MNNGGVVFTYGKGMKYEKIPKESIHTHYKQFDRMNAGEDAANCIKAYLYNEPLSFLEIIIGRMSDLYSI